MLLNSFERMIIGRYLRPIRGEGFIFVAALFSLIAVALGVGALIIVMSVMNGVRAELFDKIVGLNGHAVVQGYDGRLEDWQTILAEVRQTQRVVSAAPLIEQPLLASYDGRVEAILVRGMAVEDLHNNPTLRAKITSGTLEDIGAVTSDSTREVIDESTAAPVSVLDLTNSEDSRKIAIGAQLAQSLGLYVGSQMTIINPAGRTTPFGKVPREISYEIAAIFEIGVYDYDKAYVFMSLADAQSLLLLGDHVGLIEVKVDNPDDVETILAPLTESLANEAVVSDWKSLNNSLFEALAIERTAMFLILSIIILVAAFNIISALIMLVRTKVRDIAILRTMGASRRAILRILVAIGVAIGSVGTVIGIAGGFTLLYFRQPILNAIEAVSGLTLWDPSIYYLSELPARSEPVEVLGIAVLAIVASFLATLYPALSAANSDPVQVLRHA